MPKSNCMTLVYISIMFGAAECSPAFKLTASIMFGAAECPPEFKRHAGHDQAAISLSVYSAAPSITCIASLICSSSFSIRFALARVRGLSDESSSGRRL